MRIFEALDGETTLRETQAVLVARFFADVERPTSLLSELGRHCR